MPERRIEHGYTRLPAGWEHLGAGGAGPFETKVSYRRPEGDRQVWESRRHRKGRGPRPGKPRPDPGGKSPWLRFWAPHRLSWWVAGLLVLGSVLFTLGAVAALFPAAFGGGAAGSLVSGAAYFVGALIFTAGIYAQVLEAINAGDYVDAGSIEEPEKRFRLFAWQPERLSFLAPAVLLVGSVLFNVETALALASALGLSGLALLVGVTSLAGSVLFVASCYLQLAEICHRYLCLRVDEISWWVVVLNLLGSAGFVVGSVFGLDVPGLSTPADDLVVKLGFLQGSVFFLAGSYLMLPEIFSE